MHKTYGLRVEHKHVSTERELELPILRIVQNKIFIENTPSGP
jgi:hypothetical protein